MLKRTIIIAEAGVNHNGELSHAKKLIEAAAEAGADYVKFQTFKAENLVSKSAQKAAYQVKNTNNGDNSQFNMLKNLEMPHQWHFELRDYAQSLGIKFLSTGFDEESIDFLEKLGVNLFKVPSGELTNKPYLQHVARKGLPVILSTGMATLEEVNEAIQVFAQEGLLMEKITVLHCNTEYPTPMKDVNLKAMNYIKDTLGIEVGYSDHTLGIEVPIAAVALGANVIEKHFTLDREMTGPDHAASLEPDELRLMVRAIRNIELALSGSGKKEPSESEIKNRLIARKSIHLAKPLSSGHILQWDDLTMKRPGGGISPMDIDTIVGKILLKDLPEEHQLNWEDLQ